jgi:glycosyltransferase involved in cell wall biosynthesis
VTDHRLAAPTSGRRKRICFVLPSLNGGGAERAAVHILNALDPLVWDRSMYLFRREGAYLDAVDGGIAVSAGADRTRLGRWTALRRFLAATRPDLIVTFLSYLSVLSAAAAARTGARVVFNQQTPISAFLTDRDYHWRRPWHRRFFSLASRFGYRRADAVVATSIGVAADLTDAFGVAPGRIHIVHNPIDLEAIGQASTEPLDRVHERAWTRPVIVAAGRLADAKNYPLLLDALAVLRRTVPARLFILGEGERESAMREQIARLGLDDAVVLCGFQRNPWKFIARADVFALSSRYEGFGNVLVEAMACGVPVVATGSPGTREIVTDGADGLLVERHEPAELAGALERVLTDDGLRRTMAEQSRIKARRFALPTVAAAYARVFEAVLA